MRVIKRLRHGFSTLGIFAAAVIATNPATSMGQIITASEPYKAVGAQAQQQTPVDPASAALAASAQVDQLFLRARQALAYGDVNASKQFLTQATAQPGVVSTTGDSIAVIQGLINQQNELASMAADGKPEYNAKAANFLVAQADALVRLGDLKTAEMLVTQAKKFPVDARNYSTSPDSVLAAIQMAKQATANPAQQVAVSTVLSLMSQAQLALDKGQLQMASSLAQQAKNLNVADNLLPANQQRPWQLELKIQEAMKSGGQVVAASFDAKSADQVVQADYDPNADATKNIQVAATSATVKTNGLSGLPTFNPIPSRAQELYQAGLQAKKVNDEEGAKKYFQMAWSQRESLDATTQQALQDQLLTAPGTSNATSSDLPAPFPTTTDSNQGAGSTPAEFSNGINQQDLFRQLQSEVFRRRALAERTRAENPRAAIDILTQTRTRISDSNLSDEGKRPLLTIVDRDIAEFQVFIEKNLSDIVLREENAARLDAVRDRREKRYDTELQLQKLVEDFNKLLDEQRYHEANAIANQAYDLDPESDVVVLLKEKAAFAMNVAEAEATREAKEAAFVRNLNNVDRDSVMNVDETSPLVFNNLDDYQSRARDRAEWLSRQKYRTESERKIWNILKNEKVQGHYQGTLADAIDQLSEQSGINIIFEQVALSADSVSTSNAVDIPIRQPISLQSALNVILGTSGLVFIVEDEVIKVTSRDAQRRDVKPQTYYVGDLVTPIQNFSNTLSMNFMTPQGTVGNNGFIGQGNTVPLANHASGSISPIDIAQQSAGAGNVFGQQLPGLPPNRSPFLGGGGSQAGVPTYSSVGPQSPGGVTEADFEPLIDLIRNTIDPDGWDDTNGDGTVQAFVPNLSLIVSQTQEVQDQIQDLLKQLRELNDVQIVVEVRFVSLSDSFFERIGIDFDFNLNDNSGLTPGAIPEESGGPSTVVGLTNGTSDAAPTFSGDLDIPFQQTNFASTIPAFGGFDPGTFANFGFAILSDIEVFFLIQATKGDTRTNITQAPTVTMFNGQVASVNDGAQVPFVTSVTPVVGDFAVAQQPIITLLPEGASLNVQAIVSNDRKSVRMTLVPFFSQITNVDTFTFDGSTTTQRASDESLIDDLIGAATGVDPTPDPTELETTTQGVTVQLPTLGFTTVSTVVSVPDGGTILLGGVKRQTEQRLERGVPFLSNVPYVSRLFKNVGIGRETSSLMMMVTPRIIIQEEEEEDQVGAFTN